jgi:regulator of RNase E activity RraB
MNNQNKQNENSDFSKKVLSNTENQINTHIENLEIRNALVEIIDSKVKELGIEKSDTQSVEFFFYAESEEKANKFKSYLEEKFAYEVYGINKANDKWSIIGCTLVMSTKNSAIQKWSMQMCDLAFEFDIEFDGWGMLL